MKKKFLFILTVALVLSACKRVYNCNCRAGNYLHPSAQTSEEVSRSQAKKSCQELEDHYNEDNKGETRCSIK